MLEHLILAYKHLCLFTEYLQRKKYIFDRFYQAENVNILFHISNQVLYFNTSYFISQPFADRFYRALYHSLLDPRLIKSSKHALYLNLLYKALKSDSILTRTKAFLKRLVQICGQHEPHFICGVLYLLAEVIIHHNFI